MTKRQALLLAAICVGVYWLSGCSETRGREAGATQNIANAVAQNVADGQAGLDAFAKAPGVNFGDAAAKILAGVREYLLAAAGKTTLPPPAMTPDAILANPDGYHSGAVTAREKADGTWLKVMAMGELAVGLEVITALGKFVPGPIGAGMGMASQLFANLRWKFQSTKEAKESDDKAAELSAHAASLASLVSSLKPDWETTLPPATVAAIKAATEGQKA